MAMRIIPYSIYLLGALCLFSCSNRDKTPPEPAYFTQLREAREGKNKTLVANGILGEEYISDFNGLIYYDPDTTYIVEAKMVFGPKTLRQIKTTTEEIRNYYLFCHLSFQLNGSTHTLSAYTEDTTKTSYLFVPFKDRTTGKTTYAGGRFLEIPYKGQRDHIMLDFNQAYNPYCHYNHDYSCPLVPFENSLATEIKAGEKKLHE